MSRTRLMVKMTAPIVVFTGGLYYWVNKESTQLRIKHQVMQNKPAGMDRELYERNQRLIENIKAITKGNVNPTWEASQVKLAEREEARKKNLVKRSTNYYVPEEQSSQDSNSNIDNTKSSSNS